MGTFRFEFIVANSLSINLWMLI